MQVTDKSVGLRLVVASIFSGRCQLMAHDDELDNTLYMSACLSDIAAQRGGQHCAFGCNGKTVKTMSQYLMSHEAF